VSEPDEKIERENLPVMDVAGKLQVEAAVTFRQDLRSVLQQQMKRLACNRVD